MRYCTALVALVLFLVGGLRAAEQDFTKVAKALGLPENASTADVLKAIEKMKSPAPVPTRTPGEKVDKALDGRMAGRTPTVGVTEEKGQWYGRGEAVFLTRSIMGQDNLTTFSRYDPDGAGASLDGDEVEALGTKDIEMGFKPGMRLTLGYQLDNSLSLELSYLGLHEWEDKDTTPRYTNGELDSRIEYLMSIEAGGFRNDFFGANQQWYEYESRLHSGALDLRHRSCKMGPIIPTFTAGVRYLNISEQFRFYSDDLAPAANPHSGTFKTDTTNHLIGLQVGAETTHAFTDWASLGVKLKGGILANMAHEDVKVLNMDVIPGPPATDFVYNVTKKSDSRTGLAGLVDAGVFATFRPNKHIDLRIGYEALLVTGVAVAPMQNTAAGEISISPSARLNNSASVLYHGPSIGLTFRW